VWVAGAKASAFELLDLRRARGIWLRLITTRTIPALGVKLMSFVVGCPQMSHICQIINDKNPGKSFFA